MEKSSFDYIILGAGPAGLQLGSFLEKASRSYLIIDRGPGAGTFFQQYPRHRKLISINKPYTGRKDREHNLRMDWNSLLTDDSSLQFTEYSKKYFPDADDMVTYLNDFAHGNRLNIKNNTQITSVKKEQSDFELIDEAGQQYSCKRLIVATGVSKENVPEIPGIELVERYSEVSIDPENFIDQRVLIIGKANSAFETADDLIATTAAIHIAGPQSIKFAWQTHFVGHLRAVNNNFLDSYQLKSQNALLDGDIVNIRREGDQYVVLFRFSRSDEVEKELYYDRIISCTGFRFDDSIFEESCRPKLVINNRFPEQTEAWESSNVPHMYFAGTLTQQRDYRQATSGFIHGFRYCVKSLSNILEQRYHQKMWPCTEISLSAKDVSDYLIERINSTSALWQQFGFIGDLITIENGRCQYRQELAVDYIHKNYSDDHYFIVTLEYGPDHAKVDPFDIDVARVAQDDAVAALNAQYLHPVIRHFYQASLVSEHHVAENLENDWTGKAHIEPLFEYLELSFQELVANSKPKLEAALG